MKLTGGWLVSVVLAPPAAGVKVTFHDGVLRPPLRSLPGPAAGKFDHAIVTLPQLAPIVAMCALLELGRSSRTKRPVMAPTPTTAPNM